VSIGGGARYGELAVWLQRHGWALRNLASLPHISVAGAVATSTHGSGDSNPSLAAAVRAMDVVGPDGTLRHVARRDDDFEGSVVALGALGVVARLTLDIEPTFDVRQDVYLGLAWDVALRNLDKVMASAYSVSLVTDLRGDTIAQVWLKSRETTPPRQSLRCDPGRPHHAHAAGRPDRRADRPAGSARTVAGPAAPLPDGVHAEPGERAPD